MSCDTLHRAAAHPPPDAAPQQQHVTGDLAPAHQPLLPPTFARVPRVPQGGSPGEAPPEGRAAAAAIVSLTSEAVSSTHANILV